MKRITISAIFIFCFLTITTYSQAVAQETRFVAIVNGEGIPFDLFESSVKFRARGAATLHGTANQSDRENNVQLRQNVIEKLIVRTLLLQDAMKVNALPPDSLVNDFLEKKVASFGGKEKFSRFLEAISVPMEDFLEFSRQSYQAGWYLDNNLKKNVVVTNEECRTHYQNNLRTYWPAKIITYNFIRISYTDTSIGIEQVSQIDEEIQSLMGNGKTFNDVVKDAVIWERPYRKKRILEIDILRNFKSSEDPMNSEKWRWFESLEPGVPVYSVNSVKPDQARFIISAAYIETPEGSSFEESLLEIEKRLIKVKYNQLLQEKIKTLRGSADITRFPLN